MTREQIEARIAELKAKQEAATGWGAAVGDRREQIKELESQLLGMNGSSPVTEPVLKPCPFCGSSNIDPKGWMSSGGETGPACDECSGSTETVERWNTRAGHAQSPAGQITVPLDILRNCGCPADFRATIGQCEDSGQCGCSINLKARPVTSTERISHDPQGVISDGADKAPNSEMLGRQPRDTPVTSTDREMQAIERENHWRKLEGRDPVSRPVPSTDRGGT